jgi:NTE family protein
VGASWTAGLLQGLVSAGLRSDGCDVVLGTSAGALVGSWLTMRPEALSSLPERLRTRAAWHAENAESGYGDRELMQRLIARPPQDEEAAREVGQAAIEAITPIDVGGAKALWHDTLPEGPWPGALRIASVNANTGRGQAWSTADEIPLAVAVASSTAAPGVAPPVVWNGSIWVDGGVRSSTNADMLLEMVGPGTVLVVAPIRSDALDREAAQLGERGFTVRTITAEPFYDSFRDLLDPHFIDVAAAAGVDQAARAAADVLTRW